MGTEYLRDPGVPPFTILINAKGLTDHTVEKAAFSARQLNQVIKAKIT